MRTQTIIVKVVYYLQHIQSIWQRRVEHSVTVTYRPLCMFPWPFGYATTVEKVTTITCKTFNPYGSVAPWVSWGGICRVDVPAAGRAFCDSDLQAVMRVSLPFLICRSRWKGHHNCRQHIQSIWQRSATGQLVTIKNRPIMTARASLSNFERSCNSKLFLSWWSWSGQFRRLRCCANFVVVVVVIYFKRIVQ